MTMFYPFTALVAGPMGSSKTRFVFRLIENARTMIDPPPRRIIYCYGEYQQLFDKYPRDNFHRGLPDLEDSDDLMNETDESVANLFTKGLHHRNVASYFWCRTYFIKTNMSER